jgi:hypothetical protein
MQSVFRAWITSRREKFAKSQVTKNNTPPEQFASEISSYGFGAARESWEPFVTCFCTAEVHTYEDGLLSQWRAYGRDGGVAIEFDQKALRALFDVDGDFGKKFGTGGLLKVRYFHPTITAENIFAIADEVAGKDLTFLFEQMERLTQAEIQKDDLERIRFDSAMQIPKIAQGMLITSTFTKDYSFREENEVRLVLFAPRAAGAGINHHKVRDIIVPYVKVFDGMNIKLPIKRIIVGPHAEQRRRKSGVESLLKACGLTCEVSLSKIPTM